MDSALTNILLADRDTRLQSALKHYGKTEKDLKEYVTIIQNWLGTQKHLPEIPHQNVIINFLLMNKFSIENTKQKLESYYTIRTAFPEFFYDKHPNSPHMQEIADRVYYIPFPNVTKDGYRVSVVKVADNLPENFRVYDFYAHLYNISEVRLHEDVAIGDILIYDFEGLKVGHFLNFTPIVLRKTALILEKVYSNRIKQIHILNTPTYASTTISLAKQFMKPKISSRIFVHKSSDSILKLISLNILPSDYGGKEKSMAELNKLWKEKLAEYKERFDTLQKMRIKDELKSLPLINDEVLGFHGNFRKLDFD